MEWLFHIIICPGIKSFHFICDLPSCRQDQNLRLLIFLPEFFQKIHPIHAGQIEIQNDQIIILCQDAFQSLRPIVTGIHLIPGSVQTSGNRVTHLFLIFND